MIGLNCSATDSSNEQDLSDQLSRAEPRQYFKIHVAPNQVNGKKAFKQTKQAIRRTIAGDSVTSNQDQPNGKQKISNATLKKLLSQTQLLKSTNLTSSSKPANFKFVFIQRATAAPSNLTKSYKQSGANVPAQQSLAASVSKQLANSLLSSAASIVDNLHPVQPSLTSIASQIVGNFSDKTSLGQTDKQSPANSAPTTLSESQDIKRVTQDTKKKLNSQTNQKSSGKTKQPSKIYNLPVKFVSNGQPNSVVFNTIRQHFATIKKIQAASKVSGYMNQGKRRKQQGQKTKGNSRLIYLPLKYLSNARPNKIISGKATHKANQ